MTENSRQPKLSNIPEANQHFKNGMELKEKGQTDAALTSFRRAVLADPTFFSAHLSIGYLCREKAKADKLFLRYSFEAFRAAAREDLTHEEAHTQYIMASQQMGLIDGLLDEYKNWEKENPNNQLIKKSIKNIIAISMALMPQQSNIKSIQGTGAIRKLILIVSLICVISGLACFVAAPIMVKSGKITKEVGKNFIEIGLFIEFVAVAGLVVRSRIE